MTSTFLQEIKRRRVPQIMGLYFGASWGVIQFIDWLVNRYLLSSALTDAVLLTLLSLAPAAFLLAYNHGAPGKDPWKRFEKIGVPVNLAITMVLLGLLFHGKDLGATSQTVVVTDEDGQRIERVVPKESFRRRLAVFFWDNRSGDESLAWLQYGLPEMLAADLRQDPYLAIWTPHTGNNNWFFSRLVRAGYEDGLKVPVGLQRQAATEAHLQYFVAGAIGRSGEELTLEVSLYSTEPARQVATRTLSGQDPLSLIDELTPLLKADLGVPPGSEKLANDLSVAEHLSESVEAIRDHVEAKTAILLRNDYDAATAAWRAAVEKDPSFAVVHLRLADAYLSSGQTAEAKKAASRAIQHDYKLSERDRFVAKGSDYFLKGDVDKRTAVFEMWVELYPTDTVALSALANAYLWQGNRVEEAITTLNRILETDPTATWVLPYVGSLLVSRQAYAEALDHHRRYAELYPENASPHLDIGHIHRRLGDLEKAREHYEKALLLASGPVGPLLHLTNLDLRQGDLESARARLAEAEAQALTPQAESAVTEMKIELLQTGGEMQAAVDLLPRLVEIQTQYRSPLNITGDVKLMMADRWVLAGRLDEGLAIVDEVAESLDPPFDQMAQLGYIKIFQAARDAERLAPPIEAAEALLKSWQRLDLLHQIEFARGTLDEIEGRYPEAATAYRKALEMVTTSVQAAGGGDAERHQLLIALGRAHRLAGEAKAAEENLREVLVSYPAHPEAHLELARIESDRSQEAAARAHLEIALGVWARADATYEPAVAARALSAEL